MGLLVVSSIALKAGSSNFFGHVLQWEINSALRIDFVFSVLKLMTHSSRS
jgi:hypothetical protein